MMKIFNSLLGALNLITGVFGLFLPICKVWEYCDGNSARRERILRGFQGDFDAETGFFVENVAFCIVTILCGIILLLRRRHGFERAAHVFVIATAFTSFAIVCALNRMQVSPVNYVAHYCVMAVFILIMLVNIIMAWRLLPRHLHDHEE